MQVQDSKTIGKRNALCHGAGGCAGRIADPFRTGAGSMSPAWTVTE